LKIYFRWTDHAKADLRRIDRQHAVEILRSLADYVNSGVGDVKCLKGSRDLRLRVGDYRVRFEILEAGALRILQVKHRSEAYR
jgi:mRNA-degrading endonuclease RelE of RelBE toxin-antitoxin system